MEVEKISPNLGREFIKRLRRKRSALLSSEINVRSAIKNVQHLEAAAGCFVCQICAFSSWKMEELTAHYRGSHSDCSKPLCTYCGLCGPAELMGKHQKAHLHQADSDHQYSFRCSVCLHWVGSNMATGLTEHVRSMHCADNVSPEERALALTCVHCNCAQLSAEALARHVVSHMCRLVHCLVPGCLVKSQDKRAVLYHQNKSHPGLGRSVRVTQEVFCADGFAMHSKLPPNCLSAQCAETDSLKHSYRSKLDFTVTSPHIYCLKCSYCGFTTICWRKFVIHQTCCARCPAKSYRFLLFYCSACFACSTERRIVEEHISRDHEKAHLVQEELNLSMMEHFLANSKPSLEQTSSIFGDISLLLKQGFNSIDLASSTDSEMESKRMRLSDAAAAEDLSMNSNSDDFMNLVELNAGATFNKVSFPFDEEAFRAALGSCTPEVDDVVERMRRFSAYQVRILRKENHQRIPECPECGKAFSYGLGDFKRHLMTVHLEVPREYLRECLKCTTQLPAKCEELFSSSQEDLVLKHMRPTVLDVARRKIPLPYSRHVLRRLTEHFSVEEQEYLSHKMKTYSNLHVILDTRHGKRYRCGSCSYTSPHALADVRKHALGSHCGISTKHFRYCLQASRLDPTEFTLLSDDKLLRLARDFVRSKKVLGGGGGVVVDKSCTTPSNLSEDSEINSAFTQQGSSSPLLLNTPSESDPLDEQNEEEISPSSLHSNALSRQSSQHSSCTTTTTTQPPHDHEQDDGSCDGLDKSDCEEFIRLPFSESVLRQLTSAWLDPYQQDVLVAKMATYSTYQLMREIKSGRTMAYRCSCGRVFHAVRVPSGNSGKQMRPSTLADARRHIMGVHARISHDCLTVCCQASRISRENGWHLYSDVMLLQLASEGRNGIGGTSAPIGAGVISTATSSDNLNSVESTAVNLAASSCLSSDVKMEPGEVQLLNVVGGTGYQEEISNRVQESHHGVTAWSNKASCESTNSSDNAHHSRLHYSGNARIERTIHLPYSISALRLLTGNDCDDDTFQVLRDKMELYCSHCVLVTRQGTRRYFRCSGCTASSPHGMGDIRKHILGVHAKVPDRYKAACLHASRLTREDNKLLPDHLLLQLAKMKWKGSVGVDKNGLPTSPRARQQQMLLDAMAANPCLILPTQVSGCDNSEINPIALDNMEPLSSDPAGPHERPEVPSHLFIIKTVNSADNTIFVCSSCRHSSHNIGAVRSHIVREHMDIPGHKCLICEELFMLKNDVREHHQQEHSGEEFRLSQYSPYRFAMSRVLVRSADSVMARRAMTNDNLAIADKDQSIEEDGIDVEEGEITVMEDDEDFL